MIFSERDISEAESLAAQVSRDCDHEGDICFRCAVDAIQKARLQERKACAEVAKRYPECGHGCAGHIAYAIRAAEKGE